MAGLDEPVELQPIAEPGAAADSVTATGIEESPVPAPRVQRPLRIRVVTSLREIKEALEETWGPRLGEEPGVWFRGHGDASWKLLPSLTRDGTHSDGDEELVRGLFESEAVSYLERTPDRDEVGDLEWLFHQQHHWAPTRLLDWSTSLLVGVYFAVEEQRALLSVGIRNAGQYQAPVDIPTDLDAFSLEYGDVAGALWVLDPRRLNEAAAARTLLSRGPIVPFWPREASMDSPYVPYTFKRATEAHRAVAHVGPWAFYSRRATPRMVAQGAVFTIFDFTPVGLDQWGPEDGTHIQKLVIPPDAKKTIRDELELMGINRLRLFPTLDSVGKHAQDKLRRRRAA